MMGTMPGPIVDSASARRLLDCLRAERLAHGREDSLKASAGQLLTDRVMFGVRTRQLAPQSLSRILDALAMPARLATSLRAALPGADVVLFGAETSAAECQYKVYLEFWEQVRQQVLQTGSATPRLLNLGFKWRAGAEDGRIARYTCFPLLDTRACIQRLTTLYADAIGPTACDLAAHLVRHCAAQRPGASFIYLEAEEEGTPRRSFDINLYKAEQTLADIRPWLEALGRHFTLPEPAVAEVIAHVGSCALGHLSGGLDRRGQDFLTVYYEIEAL